LKIVKNIMNKYGIIAIEAAKLYRINNQISPEEAWIESAAEYPRNTGFRNNSSPKEIFLSLCAAKLIKGIDIPIPLNRKSSEKAEKIANLLLEFPDSLDKQIWDILKERHGYYAGCQMDVSVVRALLMEECLIFSPIVNVYSHLAWISVGNGWSYRKERHGVGDGMQEHIHVAHNKHLNVKSMQVSWNIDGTRHDDRTFNKNMDGMKTAKKIASEKLGISVNTLKFVLTIDVPSHSVEDCEIFIFHHEDETNYLLKSSKNAAMFIKSIAEHRSGQTFERALVDVENN